MLTAIVIIVSVILIVYYLYKKSKNTTTTSSDITTSPPYSYTTTSLPPSSSVVVNYDKILAWYDPSNVILNSNNVITFWPNSKDINNLGLDTIFGTFKQVTGPIIQTDTNTYSSGLKMVEFPNDLSAIYTNQQTTEMNAFVCVLFTIPTKNNDNQMLFSPLGPNIDLSFRKVGTSNLFNISDINKGQGGLIRINSEKYYEDNTLLMNYSNLYKYVVLSVRFSNDKSANGDRYDWNTPLTICIGNLVYRTGIQTGYVADRFFRGYLGDFVCLKKTHTLQDMINVETYLMNKWKISNTYNINNSSSIGTIPGSVNNNYIVAWYDPSNVSLDTNNKIKVWKNLKFNNKVLELNTIPSGSGYLKQVDYPFAYGLKVIEFSLPSAIYSTELTNDINAFVCLVKVSPNGSDAQMLFSPLGPTAEFSFRKPGQSTALNTGDLHIGSGGMVRINSVTYYEHNIKNTNYANYDKYIVLSVRFGNDRASNNDRYDWNTPINVCIGSIAFGTLRSFIGNLGDFVCLKKTHTLQDMIEVETFLMNKWNITSGVLTTTAPPARTSLATTPITK